MSLRESQSLFLDDVVKLHAFAKQEGFEVTGGELQRTLEQQEIYFRTGKSKTMDKSYHLKKLAIDLFFFKEGKLIASKEELQKLGDYWESLTLANRWGGNWTFVDCPHFERRG